MAYRRGVGVRREAVGGFKHVRLASATAGEARQADGAEEGSMDGGDPCVDLGEPDCG